MFILFSIDPSLAYRHFIIPLTGSHYYYDRYASIVIPQT